MPVKLDAKVDVKRIDGIISSLRWATSPTFASKALGAANIKRKLLTYIQSIFPRAEGKNRRPDRKFRPHLVTGFRIYDVPGTGDRVDFVLQHGKLGELWTQRVLASLEKGSRAYTQILKEGRHSFNFVPGDFRGERHSAKLRGKVDFAAQQKLRIPARKGGKYMKRTADYAKELILAAKPEYFKKVREAVKKGQTR